MYPIFRILKFTFQDIARNFSLSFMTVFILILMLLSVNTLWAVDVLTGEAVRVVKNQIDVSLYFIPEATPKEVDNIKTYIQMFPEVTEVTIRSKEEVLNSFESNYKLNKEVLAALAELGGNPFGPTMVVKTKEPKDFKKVIEALDVPEYAHLIEARSFDDHEEALDRFQNITNRVERVGWGLAVLFAFGGGEQLVYPRTVFVGINHLYHSEHNSDYCSGIFGFTLDRPLFIRGFSG